MAAQRQGSRGRELVLADGNKWLIPFMPIGPRGSEVTKQMDDISKLEDADGRTQEGLWQRNFELLESILKLNYPNLTREESEGLFDIVLFNQILSIFSGGEPKV